jgi:hypothetical protein
MSEPTARTQPGWIYPLAIAAAAWLAWVSAATAAPPGPTALPPADSFSWSGFVEYWRHYVNNGNRVIQVVMLVAVASLFIITRGKWRK